jgi:SAM-dependent methyltransferase
MVDSPSAWEHLVVPAFAYEWATDLVEDFVEPGDRVLDVACGTGIVARCARHRMRYRGHVVGVDCDEDKIALAELCEPVTVQWHVAHAERMPFRPQCFDVVLCQQGFQHFTHKLIALREMRRVICEGGRLALTVWRAAELMPVYAALENVMRDIVGDPAFKLPPFAYDDPAELKRIAEEAGFLNVELLKETKTARLEKWTDMVSIALDAYRGLFGPVEDFDEVQRGRFMVAVRDALRGYEDPDTGVVEFPMVSNVLIATGPAAPPLMDEAEIEEKVRIAIASLESS